MPGRALTGPEKPQGPAPAQQARLPGEYPLARARLADRLRAQGIRDERVLRSLTDVPRHLLVPDALRTSAYRDTPLPIGEGQTISAPGVVARMTEALEIGREDCVLEVGTGSGYQAAVLARLARRVISIERISSLAERARAALLRLGADNVAVQVGDGTRGVPEGAPFACIVVTAGGPEIPRPLLDQLAIGGRLVGPFGERGAQQLLRVRRVARDRYTREWIGRCSFVDLVGEHGWGSRA